MELLYQNGIAYYPELPENFRQATEDDFRPLADKIRTRMPFLILGYHWEVYQCYRVNTRFTIDKIALWLMAGRVFILK